MHVEDQGVKVSVNNPPTVCERGMDVLLVLCFYKLPDTAIDSCLFRVNSDNCSC